MISALLLIALLATAVWAVAASLQVRYRRKAMRELQDALRRHEATLKERDASLALLLRTYEPIEELQLAEGETFSCYSHQLTIAVLRLSYDLINLAVNGQDRLVALGGSYDLNASQFGVDLRIVFRGKNGLRALLSVRRVVAPLPEPASPAVHQNTTRRSA